MSKEAFETIVHDFETWDAGDAFADNICLYAVSKLVRGESRVAREDKQSCDDPECTTLKRYSEFRMELAPGPCDSAVSKETLTGTAEGEMVSASMDGDPTKRGGHTARFKWAGAGSSLVGRMRGIANAGTHHPPIWKCEKCDEVGHAEGWLRAAIVDGHSEGCRVAANYAVNFELRGEEGATFEGTLEGVLICQCGGKG